MGHTGGSRGAKGGCTAYPKVGVQLASSPMAEGVAVQLPIQLRRDWVARGAVSVVKAVIGVQS